MFNRILEYYRRKGREDLQEILRQCFYLKAGDTITGIYDPMRQKSRKKDMLGELIEGWGWSNDHILDLNAFKEWPFERSVELGRQINNFIVDSYKRLSQSGATSNVRINENDLTVLGRKLFTFYSRKEKKLNTSPKASKKACTRIMLRFPCSHPAGEGKEYGESSGGRFRPRTLILPRPMASFSGSPGTCLNSCYGW
jgi:adenylate cyclase class 1